MGGLQRREFQEALLDADGFEDLPGKWKAAILNAEENQAWIAPAALRPSRWRPSMPGGRSRERTSRTRDRGRLRKLARADRQ
jgi:hypothetical protein